MKSTSLVMAAGFVLIQASAQQPAAPAPAESKNVTVTLCDGRTQVELKGLKPGEEVDRKRAQEFADLFLAEWSKQNPKSTWLLAQNRTPAPAKPAAARPKPAASGAKQSEIYSRFSKRDEFVWQSEFDKFVKEGDRIFHDAKAFGGTIGVSCDMCHPHGSNTHAETYPKYQVQIQRVALLRDMINWCIQHPAKGKPLPDDDQRLRAMEAYLLAQRKGKAMEPGKH